MTDRQTGYSSVDKPWLKYYSKDAINAILPNCSIYEYVKENNKDKLDRFAINFFGRRITYRKLFERIEETAAAFSQAGVKSGDVVTVVTLSCVNSVVCFYALNKIGAVSDFINVLSNEADIQKFVTEDQSHIVVTMDLFASKVLNAIKGTCVEKVVVYSLCEDMPIGPKIVMRTKTSKLMKSLRNESCVCIWNDFISTAGKSKVDEGGYDNDLCFFWAYRRNYWDTQNGNVD